MGEVNDSWREAFQKIEYFKNQVINPVFPKADFASRMMHGTPEQAPNAFKGELSPIRLFDESEYEYKGDSKFIHYTTLFGLKAILETGYIRMSEFGNLVDKKELVYAAKVFQGSQFSNDKRLESLKENLFCLSACQSNEITKRNVLLWEIYGDKGKGVVIEFEFAKENLNSFILGNIQYGEEGLKPIQKIKQLWEKFMSNNDGFSPEDSIEFLLEMQSFHKAEKYKVEEEVRILMRENKLTYEEHDFDTIYKDINSSQEVKYFNKLYLKERHPYFQNKNELNFPHIEIKNIILGFNISIENKIDLATFLYKLKKEYNYSFKTLQINDELEIFKMS